MRLLILVVSILNILVLTPVNAAEVVGGTNDDSMDYPDISSAAPASKPPTEEDKATLRARSESATNPFPDIPGINVDGNEAARRGANYDVVAVINKSTDAQSVTVYRYVSTTDITGKTTRHLYKEPQVFPVSTGREKWVCADIKDKSGQITGREAHWTGTPTGFFNPFYLDADHHSSAYDDANMYGAVFFNRLGIATHEGELPARIKGPKGEDLGPGKPQSHGCVRMGPKGARTLFKYVLESGGMFKPTDSTFDGKCPSEDRKDGDDLGQCLVDADTRMKEWHQLAQSTLDEGPKTGFGPWDPSPQIPDINQDGSTKRDANGYAIMKPGYRALYVVECVTKAGQDCSTTKIPPKKDCSGVMVAEGAPGLPPGSLNSDSRFPPPPAPPKKQYKKQDPITNFLHGIFH